MLCSSVYVLYRQVIGNSLVVSNSKSEGGEVQHNDETESEALDVRDESTGKCPQNPQQLAIVLGVISKLWGSVNSQGYTNIKMLEP